MIARNRAKAAFDITKGIAALGFLLERTGASMYSLLKMMYLADKQHIGRYGRFIAGDYYCALPQGPVPSCTYDLLKSVRGEYVDIAGAEIARDYFSRSGEYTFKIIKTPDFDELSVSDVECLSEVADLYNRFGAPNIRRMSHDDAWTRTWANVGPKKSQLMPIEDIILDAGGNLELLEHVRDPQPGMA
jgi:uncharacterized phage-associated protein